MSDDFNAINEEVLHNFIGKPSKIRKEEGGMEDKSFYDKYANRGYTSLLGGVSSRTDYGGTFGRYGNQGNISHTSSGAGGNISKMFNRILKNMYDTNINKAVTVTKKVRVRR